MPSKRRQTAVRLSAETDELIAKLRERFGLNTTGVIELAVRHLAEPDRVKIPLPPEQDR